MQICIIGVYKMKYYESVYDENSGCVYSCDMVRFSVEIRKDCAEKFSKRFSADTRLDVNVYPIDYRPFKYRQMLSVSVGESTVSMAIGFNGFGSPDDRLRGYIEFNPNKCFPEWHDEFIDVCGWCCKMEVARVDLAVDIPIARSGCALVKDGRLYEYQQKSEDDYTEYLGRRNVAGRVKLYNKTKESGLSYTLTRLEITTEADVDEFKKHIPEVVINTTEQLDFGCVDMSDLTQNEQVYVSILNRLPLSDRVQYMKRFTYRHRKKLEKYIFTENRLEINLNCVREVFRNVNRYSNLCA